MLVQHCTLDEHRLIVQVSITKPVLHEDIFKMSFNQQSYRALVDTGAQRSVVSRRIITQQKLSRIGHMQFSSLHGPKTHGRYLASIGIWSTNRIDPEGEEITEQSLFSIEQPFEVVDMEENINFDMILGFDVLKNLSFNFDHKQAKFSLKLST
ncbi:MAG: aspartyl protease family protein [Pseudomonadota bacterium]